MEGKRGKSVPYNDIDLERWKEYTDVLLDSLWIVGSRERGGGHRLDYHGNFIPQIATQIFTRYSKSGEIVLDMFLGSGTSAIEALNMGRKCVGVEINPAMVEHVRHRIEDTLWADDVRNQIDLVEADSSSDSALPLIRQAFEKLGTEHAHLLILHPPYWDIIKFSELEGDLSGAASVDEFLDMFGQVAKNGYELLAPGRFAALVIGDKYSGGELVPLGFLCMQKMNEVGFRTKSIIVKNIEGNEIGKGRDNNLWRYRALAGGFYIFKHEYIMVFQKPA